MRKKPLLFIAIFFFTFAAYGQDEVYLARAEQLIKFSKNYFRSDPFAGEFSSFLKHLINDPAIIEKNIQKRTDTTLYSFYGTYTSYNPFFFKPKRVEILLEETPVEYIDSLQTRDTIFAYQLMAYADDDNAGNEETLKEFEKINRQTGRKLENNYRELKNGNEITARIYNYFMPGHLLSPLSIAWGRLPGQHELVLNITLRFKMSANVSVLPGALESFAPATAGENKPAP